MLPTLLLLYSLVYAVCAKGSAGMHVHYRHEMDATPEAHSKNEDRRSYCESDERRQRHLFDGSTTKGSRTDLTNDNALHRMKIIFKNVQGDRRSSRVDIKNNEQRDFKHAWKFSPKRRRRSSKLERPYRLHTGDSNIRFRSRARKQHTLDKGTKVGGTQFKNKNKRHSKPSYARTVKETKYNHTNYDVAPWVIRGDMDEKNKNVADERLNKKQRKSSSVSKGKNENAELLKKYLLLGETVKSTETLSKVASEGKRWRSSSVSRGKHEEMLGYNATRKHFSGEDTFEEKMLAEVIGKEKERMKSLRLLDKKKSTTPETKSEVMLPLPSVEVLRKSKQKYATDKAVGAHPASLKQQDEGESTLLQPLFGIEVSTPKERPKTTKEGGEPGKLVRGYAGIEEKRWRSSSISSKHEDGLVYITRRKHFPAEPKQDLKYSQKHQSEESVYERMQEKTKGKDVFQEKMLTEITAKENKNMNPPRRVDNTQSASSQNKSENVLLLPSTKVTTKLKQHDTTEEEAGTHSAVVAKAKNYKQSHKQQDKVESTSTQPLKHQNYRDSTSAEPRSEKEGPAPEKMLERPKEEDPRLVVKETKNRKSEYNESMPSLNRLGMMSKDSKEAPGRAKQKTAPREVVHTKLVFKEVNGTEWLKDQKNNKTALSSNRAGMTLLGRKEESRNSKSAASHKQSGKIRPASREQLKRSKQEDAPEKPHQTLFEKSINDAESLQHHNRRDSTSAEPRSEKEGPAPEKKLETPKEEDPGLVGKEIKNRKSEYNKSIPSHNRLGLLPKDSKEAPGGAKQKTATRIVAHTKLVSEKVNGTVWLGDQKNNKTVLSQNRTEMTLIRQKGEFERIKKEYLSQEQKGVNSAMNKKEIKDKLPKRQEKKGSTLASEHTKLKANSEEILKKSVAPNGINNKKEKLSQEQKNKIKSAVALSENALQQESKGKNTKNATVYSEPTMKESGSSLQHHKKLSEQSEKQESSVASNRHPVKASRAYLRKYAEGRNVDARQKTSVSKKQHSGESASNGKILRRPVIALKRTNMGQSGIRRVIKLTRGKEKKPANAFAVEANLSRRRHEQESRGKNTKNATIHSKHTMKGSGSSLQHYKKLSKQNEKQESSVASTRHLVKASRAYPKKYTEGRNVDAHQKKSPGLPSVSKKQHSGESASNRKILRRPAIALKRTNLGQSGIRRIIKLTRAKEKKPAKTFADEANLSRRRPKLKPAAAIVQKGMAPWAYPKHLRKRNRAKALARYRGVTMKPYMNKSSQ